MGQAASLAWLVGCDGFGSCINPAWR
jgi:hypothetical protein